ncbi:hypothetical protein [Streptomyces sp. NK15101]|uniref:hypothetical protein n=1 Tax=Streptomyces sp. NK15101 TaxID=2873261 RepID=UPI001CED1C67|nr:hypothetical protein [Streptomyces sp. NK15101]
MHARRTTFLLLVALLATGCVAVPHGSAPTPAARPGGLAPAADRAPAPLPTWPAPTEPAPREALTTTGPRPAPQPARAPGRKAAEEPAARRPRPHEAAGHRPRPPADEPGESVNRKRTNGKRADEKRTNRRPVNNGPGTTRTPSHPRHDRPAPARPQPRTDARPQPRTDARPPEMRRLCHQAESIRAPMGAAALCRDLYGR